MRYDVHISSKPLVLDLTSLLPGAYCTRLLQQIGWRIVRIEPPAGDMLLQLDPELYEMCNSGKEVLRLNLSDETDRGSFLRLLREATVLVESYRPKVVKKLGLLPDALWKVNSALVVASLRGYPQSELQERPGHDINYQAESGCADIGRDLAGRPVYWGLQVSNFAGGLTAAFSILAAVSSGARAQHVDIDLCSVLASWALPRAAAKRREREKFAAYMNPPGYGYYQTKDQHWIALGVREPKFRAALRQALRLEEPVTHEAVEKAVGSYDRDGLEALFDEADVPYSRVRDVESLLDAPFPGVLGDLQASGNWMLGIGGLERWTKGRAND